MYFQGGDTDMTAIKSKAGKTKAKAIPPPNDLRIPEQAGKSEARALAEVAINPVATAMAVAQRFNKGTFGDLSLTETFDVLGEQVAAFEKGDHTHQRALLIGQSVALNAIFAELARRAALNMGEYINASERYMRLALKAQAQSRATVETLDRLARGGEQVIRHVHVDNRGGQAVIAETVNTGGQENGKFDGQPYAIEGCAASLGQPLRSEDAQREAMPLASNA
jgi:hypothetical protein